MNTHCSKTRLVWRCGKGSRNVVKRWTMIGTSTPAGDIQELKAVREAYQVISAAGAEVAGLVISLDRQERGQGAFSAVQELKQSLDIPVVSIVQLDDLINILEESSEYEEFLDPVLSYRKQYGVIS